MINNEPRHMNGSMPPPRREEERSDGGGVGGGASDSVVVIPWQEATSKLRQRARGGPKPRPKGGDVEGWTYAKGPRDTTRTKAHTPRIRGCAGGFVPRGTFYLRV